MVGCFLLSCNDDDHDDDASAVAGDSREGKSQSRGIVVVIIIIIISNNLPTYLPRLRLLYIEPHAEDIPIRLGHA